MKIISWFKGKKKQREMRKIEPDKEFQFKKDYYGETEILEGFKFVYCNNYTDKLYNAKDNDLSFISCVITLPNTRKIATDLIKFMNIYIHNKMETNNYFVYDNIYIEMNDNQDINIFIRGDIYFYESLCDNIHNNIITKYIRNNIFPNEYPIKTPNEFLNNIYNSINYPSKEIDILFIEDNILCKELSPVIGLSVSKKSNKINLDERDYKTVNGRIILYIELNKIHPVELDYIIDNVEYGNKLLELVHKCIESDDIDSEIDEIIEE